MATSTRDLLLASRKQLLQSLQLMYASDRSLVEQGVLESVRMAFGALGEQGNLIPIPSHFRVNLKTREVTDLPHWGVYESFIKEIRIHDALSAECLNSLENHFGDAGLIARRVVLDTIIRSLQSTISVTERKLWSKPYNGYELRCWNDIVDPQVHWTAALIEKAMDDFRGNGLFTLSIRDERFGLVRTSETETSPDMGKRQWLHDSCKAGLQMRKTHPHLWSASMLTNGMFMCTKPNMHAMFQTVRDPEFYRGGDVTCGMAHLFLAEAKNSESEGLRWNDALGVPDIESLIEDPEWGNRKRLGSQALLLFWLIRTLKGGAFLGDSNQLGRPWGFRWTTEGQPFPEGTKPLTEAGKSYVIQSIQVLSAYLMAVQWNGSLYDFQAPSVGDWEETRLRGGCASDWGHLVDAFEQLRELLYEPAFLGRPIIAEIRQRLLEPNFSNSDGESMHNLLANHPFADFRDESRLRAFITAGRTRIAELVTSPAERDVGSIGRRIPSVAQFPGRDADSSLALLAAYHQRFDDHPIRDARIRFGIHTFLESALMHEHLPSRLGMQRYSPFFVEEGFWVFDSYLNGRFREGLILPGLVEPHFARSVKYEFERWVRDYRDARLRDGRDSAEDWILQDGYHRCVVMAGKNGAALAHKDAHDLPAMRRRQQFSLPKWQAQWTIGPTASLIALARAKLSILKFIKQSGPDGTLALLEAVERALTRTMNLCVTTVVKKTDANGNPMLRADGSEIPRTLAVMEAFQAVFDVEDRLEWSPGFHTLPWSECQLYEGMLNTLEAARFRESLGI